MLTLRVADYKVLGEKLMNKKNRIKFELKFIYF